MSRFPPRQSLLRSLAALSGLRMALVVCLAAGTASAMKTPPPVGQNTALADQMPKELVGIGIEDKSGVVVPKHLVFKGHEGEEVRLESLLDGQRPVLLVLAYYSCPMLCTLVLNGVSDALKKLAWTAGEEYRVVTVSIDPRDTAEIAKGKAATYREEYGRLTKDDAWLFLTGDEKSVKELADSVGFSYAFDEATDQYVHAAGAFVLTPSGQVSRTLYGIEFNQMDLRMAIAEASEGRVGSAVDKVLLFCFHYDPHSKGYVVAAFRLMRAGGLLTALTLAIVVGRFWRRERKRTKSPQES